MVTVSARLVPSAEVAFIAGLSDREINRVADEAMLPEVIYSRTDGRRFARIFGTFARFYFDNRELSKRLREHVINVMTERLMQRADWDEALALKLPVRVIDWTYRVGDLTLGLMETATQTKERADRVARAYQSISENSETMQGVPVFKNTRLPIDGILASSDPAEIGRLRKSYPFLTDEMVEDARIYREAHPRRGRPMKPGSVGEANPKWKETGRKTVQRPSNTKSPRP